MSFLHRACRASLAETEKDLQAAEGRASRLAERVVVESDRAATQKELRARDADAALDRRLKDQAERERLTAELKAARERIVELQGRLDEMSAHHDSHRARLERRRARAAEVALGDAWAYPGAEEQVRRAAVAQAILALPLSAFDVDVFYDTTYPGTWYLDGRPVELKSYLVSYDARDYLMRRYGIGEAELDGVQSVAEYAHRERENEKEGAVW